MKKFNYIYLITNKLNGKIYVGKHSTNNLDDGYMGSGKIIKQSITKYGIENFTKEYLAFCDTEENLNWLEKFYIKKYKAREVGYNITYGGDGVCGIKHSEESKHKISMAIKGRHLSYDAKKKLSEARKGIHFTIEHKQKLSEAQKKNKLSDETKMKISISSKKPKNRYKWLTPSGEIREMSSNLARRYHPDWKKIEESF